MTKGEFLIKLREALENDLDSRMAQENVDYYDSYIREEVSKGRSESSVVEELGDPWVIARSIIEMEENRSGAGNDNHSHNSQTYSYDDNGYEGYTEEKDGRGFGGFSGYTGSMPKIYALDSWWKKLLLVLGVIGILMIVGVVISGLITIVMPLVMPIVFIMILFRFLRRLR